MTEQAVNGWIEAGCFVQKRMPLMQLPAPAEQTVDLWYLDLAEIGGSLRNAFADPSEPPPADVPLGVGQLRFARRFYLRLLLGAYLGIPGKDVEINRSNRGKPVLDVSRHQSSLKFSMAKSEDRLLIGVSASKHLGVDLEPQWRRARNPLALAKRYFSSAEFAALQGLPADRIDEAFLRAWACNEAVVKASGLGIANQLNRFTLQMDPDLPPAVLEIENDQAEEWSLMLVKPCEEFIGALASRQPLTQVNCYRLNAAT